MKIEVLYEGDLHTIATHTNTGQTLHTDAPKDNKGKGLTFSPTDLVATAYASCIATVMGIFAKTKGIELAGLQILVEKSMTKTAPRRIEKLQTHIKFPSHLTEKERLDLLEIGTSCPVHHSLHPDIATPITHN